MTLTGPIEISISFSSFFQSDAAYPEIEARAMVVAKNLGAEFWPTSSKTGILSRCFFSLP